MITPQYPGFSLGTDGLPSALLIDQYLVMVRLLCRARDWTSDASSCRAGPRDGGACDGACDGAQSSPVHVVMVLVSTWRSS